MIEFKRNTDDGKKAFPQSTPLPPGRYAVTVEKVVVAVKEFAKKQKNPTGQVLNLHLATTIDGKKRFVFDDIATNDTRRIDELTAAVGLPVIQDGERFDEQKFVGRDLQVLVGVWTSKKDSTKKGNEVTDYLPRMNP